MGTHKHTRTHPGWKACKTCMLLKNWNKNNKESFLHFPQQKLNARRAMSELSLKPVRNRRRVTRSLFRQILLLFWKWYAGSKGGGFTTTIKFSLLVLSMAPLKIIKFISSHMQTWKEILSRGDIFSLKFESWVHWIFLLIGGPAQRSLLSQLKWKKSGVKYFSVKYVIVKERITDTDAKRSFLYNIVTYSFDHSKNRILSFFRWRDLWYVLYKEISIPFIMCNYYMSYITSSRLRENRFRKL